jgi:SAM-dependent methyltransferase
MASWLLKAAVQGAISPLPGRDRLNHLLQTHVTGSITLTEEVFERKRTQCRRHLESYLAQRGRPPKHVLELGTGWYPVVPLGMIVAGVERVTTIDVNPLCDLGHARAALEKFGPALTADPSARDAAQLLEPLRVRLLVGDARESGLAAGSVDLFVSNNTLEHIPPQSLREILAEFRRLAAPGAVMDHFIDMSDHYAHFDDSITEFNYLRYSDRAWRVFNNRLQYQSRLRISDYRRLIEAAGFRVVAEDVERGPGEALDAIPLARRFRHYRREDLTALRGWLTAVTV